MNETEILNEAELNYLQSLRKNPTWRSILEKISTYKAPPLYTPAIKEPKAQYDRWVFESGSLTGVKGLISLLNGCKTPIILKQEDK